MRLNYKPEGKILRKITYYEIIDFFDECVSMDDCSDVADIVEYPSVNWFWFSIMVQIDKDIKKYED